MPISAIAKQTSWVASLRQRHPSLSSMTELQDDQLRNERKHLLRALKHIAFEEATGMLEGNRHGIKELLILRIAEIDQLLSGEAK